MLTATNRKKELKEFLFGTVNLVQIFKQWTMNWTRSYYSWWSELWTRSCRIWTFPTLTLSLLFRSFIYCVCLNYGCRLMTAIRALELCIIRTFCFWSKLDLFFLPLILGELYWKPYLPIWPLLSHWCCVSSPLPPRHSFCVPGTEEGSWMPALPSGSLLWQACYGGALRRCPLSRRVNTFALVLIQWEDFMFFTLLYWLVWAEGG